MEYLLVATGHPVKRCLLQSNNLPKSIPELSLQNWRIFLAPQIENIQKRLTCYQNPNLTLLTTLYLTISKKYFDLFNSADDKLLFTKISIIVPVQREEKEETHTILFICSVPFYQIEKEKMLCNWMPQCDSDCSKVWKAISITCPSSPLASLQLGLPEDSHWAAGN